MRACIRVCVLVTSQTGYMFIPLSTFETKSSGTLCPCPPSPAPTLQAESLSSVPALLTKGKKVPVAGPYPLVWPRSEGAARNRKFNFKRATMEQCASAAAVVSLFAWWAAAADLPPDHTVSLCWHGMSNIIPRRRAAHLVTDERLLDSARALALHAGADPSALEAWWQAGADSAFVDLLKLDKLRLKGVSITSQTSAALRLKVKKMQPLDRVSPDGAVFPSDPADFKAEVLRQARELYAGRAGAQMNTFKLLSPATREEPSHDTPDFTTQMMQASGEGLCARRLDEDPTIMELETALKSGSDATALDELPRPILSRLGGHGLLGILHLVQACRRGGRCAAFDTALHIPLRKKEPRWLLKNSRPVLLEAFLRRALTRLPAF